MDRRTFVGYWGGSIFRIRAAILLFLYTLTGSLFILLGIVTLWENTGTLDIINLSFQNISQEWQIYLFICFFVAFAIKCPLIPVHSWLPLAHAEAPIAGSIVLAGTVLKASSYGFLRIIIPIIPDGINYYIPIIQTLGIITLALGPTWVLGAIYARTCLIEHQQLWKHILSVQTLALPMLIIGDFNCILNCEYK